jgi:hypothetical protein
MSRKSRVAFDVSSLADLDAEALRAEWREQLGGDPPPLRAPELLRRELAWRLDASIHGDIEPSLKQRLDVLARQAARGAPPTPSGARPAIGSTIVREWDGVAYSVVVLAHGFLFEGETHRSLSGIARRITGVRWSGPRFFGLGPAPAERRAAK